MTAAGPRPLVVGVGNRDRGDDAVGPIVADAVRSASGGAVDTEVIEGDLSDLALRWRPDQPVIVVDAMVSGRPPGTMVELDGLHGHLGRSTSGLLSSHGIGLAEAVRLAGLLGRRPASLTVLAIEAASFDHFAPLSEPVAAAAIIATERIRSVLGPSGRSRGCEHGDEDLDRSVDHQERYRQPPVVSTRSAHQERGQRHADGDHRRPGEHR